MSLGKLFGFGKKPNDLSRENPEAKEILRDLQRTSIPPLAIGDKVAIVQGPFTDFSGTVHSVDQRGLIVEVLMDMYGQELIAQMDSRHVVKL